ncbi:MAG: hypothetical protein KHX56_04925 [Clostridiales bacterium]|nr:hypothetical protein [Clostridiales bacterium]
MAAIAGYYKDCAKIPTSDTKDVRKKNNAEDCPSFQDVFLENAESSGAEKIAKEKKRTESVCTENSDDSSGEMPVWILEGLFKDYPENFSMGNFLTEIKKMDRGSALAGVPGQELEAYIKEAAGENQANLIQAWESGKAAGEGGTALLQNIKGDDRFSLKTENVDLKAKNADLKAENQHIPPVPAKNEDPAKMVRATPGEDKSVNLEKQNVNSMALPESRSENTKEKNMHTEEAGRQPGQAGNDMQANLADNAVGRHSLPLHNENMQKTEATTLVRTKAVPSVLAEDVVQVLKTHISSQNEHLEIALEPEHLGKIVIDVFHKAGHTEIMLRCSEEKTWDLLGHEAKNMGQIMEAHLKEPTVVFVEGKESDYINQEKGQESRQQHEDDRGRQPRKDEAKEDSASFLHQLRLGLI